MPDPVTPVASTHPSPPPRLPLILSILLLLSCAAAGFFYWQLTSEKQSRAAQAQQYQTEKQSLENQLSQLRLDLVTAQTPVDPPAPSSPFTDYFPIQYSLGQVQQVGQTFTPDSDLTLTGFRLQGSFGQGQSLTLTVYEQPEPNIFSDLSVVTQSDFPATNIIKGKEFDVRFPAPVVLLANQTYFLVLAPGSKNTQAGIGFLATDATASGAMYTYAQTAPNPTPSWQPKPDSDLIFTPF